MTTSSEAGAVTELRGADEHPLVRLTTEQSAGAEPVRVPHTGLFHTAFRYPDRPSLAAAVARTAQVAREFQGASDHGVSEAVYFADPEGNGIELYRDRPFEEWPDAEPGQVGMFTAPLDLPALLEEAGDAVAPDIGHIHLMTADTSRALGFWRDAVGLDERQRFGPSAVFLAEGLYHHHIGANSWHSAGAEPGTRGPAGPRVVRAQAAKRRRRRSRCGGPRAGGRSGRASRRYGRLQRSGLKPGRPCRSLNVGVPPPRSPRGRGGGIQRSRRRPRACAARPAGGSGRAPHRP